MKKIVFFGLIILLYTACHNDSDKSPENSSTSVIDNFPLNINYSVVNSYPHDTTSYTEGFLFHEGSLYESEGHTDEVPSSRSLFGQVNLQTGQIQAKAELDKTKYFGEGIAFLSGKLFQLTYTTRIGFIYDAKTFKKIGEFTYPSQQGWGMTTNGKYLIMTDGSNQIRWLDPASSEPLSLIIHYENGDSASKTIPLIHSVKTLSVTDNNGPVSDLNEPELINGFLYVNQYRTYYILKIDTASGKYPPSAEMNGIAYDSATNKVYITGKLWPNIYELKFSY